MFAQKELRDLAPRDVTVQEGSGEGGAGCQGLQESAAVPRRLKFAAAVPQLALLLFVRLFTLS